MRNHISDSGLAMVLRSYMREKPLKQAEESMTVCGYSDTRMLTDLLKNI